MEGTFPVIYGICLDAEAIWLGKAPENAQRPVLLSHGAYEIREGLAPLLDLLDRHASGFSPVMFDSDCMPRTSSDFSSAADSVAGGLWPCP